MMVYFTQTSTWLVLAQVLVILMAVWLFYSRFVKGTDADKLVRGLIGLVALWAVSWIFIRLDLDILGGFTRWIAIFLSVGLVVIFQPELRKFLGMLGQVRFLRALFSPGLYKDAHKKEAIASAATEIIKAVEYMSAKHTGALIVFRDQPDWALEEAGTAIHADISSELLLTIFFNKTPLHDGAVIIGNNKILYAGVILPLTNKNDLNWKYGTRHRAAIGMSEQSDALVLVVSEETGDVSVAYHGKLIRSEDMKKLRNRVETALRG
jgi:diadenylate cyclase